MSILIKGMEMPTSCYSCPLRKRNGMDIVCPVAKERFSVADVNILFYRLKNCPLGYVPAPHGRLVDLNHVTRIVENLRDRNVDNDDMAFALNWAGEVIKKLPTIIEAEEVHNG